MQGSVLRVEPQEIYVNLLFEKLFLKVRMLKLVNNYSLFSVFEFLL